MGSTTPQEHVVPADTASGACCPAPEQLVLRAVAEVGLLRRIHGRGLRRPMSPRHAGVGAAPMETVDTIDTIGVWRDFHHRLVGYVARRVANVADAEDIVQEMMLRIHRHRDQLGDVRHVSAWVYRITDNAITDYYRGADRRERPVADLPAAHRLAGQASVPSDQDGLDGDRAAVCAA